ncbi:thioredoxin-like protein [Mollisia scopiformis]|uniref:Protein disulfide-isomerase n=1 Tax=Mollisia scopiformis TaxID=149040 RepID=A0A132B6F7_MOLSC|nr:thioredoxin-like protein [Mollisia scopiformis]KUJ07474.1 thioredoxin-like protein [Mollisia scopiformis]
MTRAILELTSTDDVLVLNSQTFLDAVNTNRMLLVSFFHKLIPNCARFVHVFERTAQTARGSGVQFAQIDITENATFCQNFGLASFPAVMMFQVVDNARKYGGVMEENQLMLYLTRQTSPPVSIITADTMQDFKASNEVVVVAYLTGADERLHDAFISFATEMRDDFLFGVTCDEILHQKEQIKRPSIVVYNSFEDENKVHELSDDRDLMRAFVKAATRPLIVEFRPELHDSYFKARLPLGYIFIDSSKDRERLSKMVRPLAKKYNDEILFGTVDKKDMERFPTWADYLWFSDVKHWPSFTIREPIKNLRFPFDEQKELSYQELSEFVETFRKGHLKPEVKSQPVPDVQKSPVLDVVGLTYDEIVLEDEKDVLLEFCTDWCPHCIASRSTYELLATVYTSTETLKNQVTIATIDLEKNDFPDRDVRGVPWFKLYPAHKKDAAVLYYGPTTLDDMAKFIRDHGTHKAYPKRDSANAKIELPAE